MAVRLFGLVIPLCLIDHYLWLFDIVLDIVRNLECWFGLKLKVVNQWKNWILEKWDA